MSTNFYVILPSSCPYKGDSSGVNKPNKFKIHLPKTLIFDGIWQCGLAAISYPRTWPSVGSFGRQHIVIKFKDGRKFVAPVPAANPSSEIDLSNFLNTLILPEAIRMLDNRFIPSRRKREAPITNAVIEAVSSNSSPKKSPHEIKLEKKNRLIFIENEAKSLLEKLAEETLKLSNEKNLDEKFRKISFRGTNAANIINLYVEALEILSPDTGYLNASDVEQYDLRRSRYLQAKNDINQSQVSLEREINEAIKARREKVKTTEQTTAVSSVANIDPSAISSSNNAVIEAKVQKKHRLVFLETEAKRLLENLATETGLIQNENNLEEKRRKISLRGSNVTQLISMFTEALNLLDTEKGNLSSADVEQYSERKTRYMQAKHNLKQSQTLLENEVKKAVEEKKKIEERKKQIEKERREAELRQQEEDKKIQEREKQAERERQEAEIRQQEENKKIEEREREKQIEKDRQESETLQQRESENVIAPEKIEPAVAKEEIVEVKATDEVKTQVRDTDLKATEGIYSNIHQNVQYNEKLEEKNMEKALKENSFYFPAIVSDEEIKEALSSLKFNFLQHVGKFEVQFSDKIDSIQLSPALNYTLGFTEGRFLENKENATRMPDIRGGIDQLYVYTNVCQDMVVGDRLCNLIRNVTVSGQVGQVVENIYDRPIMNRILHHSIDEIEVEIRTNDGTLIPFQTGETILTLYFKKILFF